MSIAYTCAFFIIPFDPETKDEKSPLLDGGKVRLSPDDIQIASAQELASSKDETSHGDRTMFIHLIFFTLTYALICAGRFNSIKALLQMRWPADESHETNENLEVRACILSCP